MALVALLLLLACGRSWVIGWYVLEASCRALLQGNDFMNALGGIARVGLFSFSGVGILRHHTACGPWSDHLAQGLHHSLGNLDGALCFTDSTRGGGLGCEPLSACFNDDRCHGLHDHHGLRGDHGDLGISAQAGRGLRPNTEFSMNPRLPILLVLIALCIDPLCAASLRPEDNFAQKYWATLDEQTKPIFLQGFIHGCGYRVLINQPESLPVSSLQIPKLIPLINDFYKAPENRNVLVRNAIEICLLEMMNRPKKQIDEMIMQARYLSSVAD